MKKLLFVLVFFILCGPSLATQVGDTRVTSIGTERCTRISNGLEYWVSVSESEEFKQWRENMAIEMENRAKQESLELSISNKKQEIYDAIVNGDDATTLRVELATLKSELEELAKEE